MSLDQFAQYNTPYSQAGSWLNTRVNNSQIDSKLTLPQGATPGYFLMCSDSKGNATWSPASAGGGNVSGPPGDPPRTVTDTVMRWTDNTGRSAGASNVELQSNIADYDSIIIPNTGYLGVHEIDLTSHGLIVGPDAKINVSGTGTGNVVTDKLTVTGDSKSQTMELTNGNVAANALTVDNGIVRVNNGGVNIIGPSSGGLSVPSVGASVAGVLSYLEKIKITGVTFAVPASPWVTAPFTLRLWRIADVVTMQWDDAISTVNNAVNGFAQTNLGTIPSRFCPATFVNSLQYCRTVLPPAAQPVTAVCRMIVGTTGQIQIGAFNPSNGQAEAWTSAASGLPAGAFAGSMSWIAASFL
jgi:hypothetical protein